MAKNITTTSLSESLTLRALRLADPEQLHALELQPAMLHGNPGAPYPTLEKTRAWLEKIDSSNVANAAVVGDILVGFGTLLLGKLCRAHTATVAVGVHDAWHGRGVGSALTAEMPDLADQSLGLRRVELNVFTDNQPAIVR
jgi:putative acetyltransferase